LGEKWKLVKVNGERPGDKDLKRFNKAHNTLKSDVNAQIDDDFYRIVEDNENEMVVSLRFRKETLPKRYKFLGRCTGMAYIDKKKKRLERIEYKNDYPVKVWMYKATGLTLIQHYTFDEKEKKYFITREEMDIDSNYMGKGISILYDIYYSDYKKVR
jgi:hypothetical protein